MKKLIVLILIGFFMGCNDDVIKEDQPDDTLKSGKIIERNLVLRNLQGSFTYEANPGNEECPLIGITFGTGNATHLGKINFQHKYCCNETGYPLFYIEGCVVAANGDKFFTMVTEEWVDEDGLNHQHSEITGGTGRFEDCTGELTMIVSVDWVNMSFTAEGFGTISY